MAGSTHPETCEACRIIDQADGTEDGRLYRSFTSRARSGYTLTRAAAHIQDRGTDAVSRFAGSITFVYVHLAWFGLWIGANVGLFGQRLRFDPFPFGLLTMIVSLEAIFLSTFILITQNRQGAASELRAEFDFRNNVRGEIWAAHIGQALGLDATHVEHVVQDIVDGYMDETEERR